MKGALLELAARGEEDIPLLGNPKFSYFKSVYRAHTNFSKFETKNVFQSGWGFGRKATCVIEKKGDLLVGSLLALKLTATGNPLVSWINGIGNYIIKKLSFKIGGETISEMSGEYLDIFYKYYLPAGHYPNYLEMVRKIPGYREFSLINEQYVYVPLPFWFMKKISQALPVISLGYHDLVIEIDFRDLTDCLYSTSAKSGLGSLVNLSNLEIEDAYIYNSFIYLDKQERQFFLEKEEINYIIEQIQEDEYSLANGQTTRNLSLHFNHPVKELIWTYRGQYFENLNRWDKYSAFDTGAGTEKSPLLTSELLFNGQQRFIKLQADYFRLVQPVAHHNSSSTNYIYFYSFALHADDVLPSGTCNFGKIDDVRLNLTLPSYITEGNIRVYAVNYNYLKIKKGMGGILYT
jgi:hypothetical protein